MLIRGSLDLGDNELLSAETSVDDKRGGEDKLISDVASDEGSDELESVVYC